MENKNIAEFEEVYAKECEWDSQFPMTLNIIIMERILNENDVTAMKYLLNKCLDVDKRTYLIGRKIKKQDIEIKFIEYLKIALLDGDNIPLGYLLTFYDIRYVSIKDIIKINKSDEFEKYLDNVNIPNIRENYLIDYTVALYFYHKVFFNLMKFNSYRNHDDYWRNYYTKEYFINISDVDNLIICKPSNGIFIIVPNNQIYYNNYTNVNTNMMYNFYNNIGEHNINTENTLDQSELNDIILEKINENDIIYIHYLILRESRFIKINLSKFSENLSVKLENEINKLLNLISKNLKGIVFGDTIDEKITIENIEVDPCLLLKLLGYDLTNINKFAEYHDNVFNMKNMLVIKKNGNKRHIKIH